MKIGYTYGISENIYEQTNDLPDTIWYALSNSEENYNVTADYGKYVLKKNIDSILSSRSKRDSLLSQLHDKSNAWIVSLINANDSDFEFNEYLNNEEIVFLNEKLADQKPSEVKTKHVYSGHKSELVTIIFTFLDETIEKGWLSIEFFIQNQRYEVTEITYKFD